MAKSAKRKRTKRVSEPLLKKVIRDYCFQRLALGNIPEDFKDDTDMFEAGIMDSLDLLELLIGLEEDYGIEIPEVLGDVSGIASINGLSKFVLDNVGVETLEEKFGVKLTLD